MTNFKPDPATEAEKLIPRRVPRKRFIGELANIMLHNLISDVPRRNRMLDADGWTGARVMGYKIPEWQRNAVWTPAQEALYITSIYEGGNCGKYMVNSTMFNKEFDGLLIDGQQRLRAIERYIDGHVRVRGEDGIEYTWIDLTEREHRHFLRMSFDSILTPYTDLETIIAAYRMHNFGGTAHTEEDRPVSVAPDRAITAKAARAEKQEATEKQKAGRAKL